MDPAMLEKLRRNSGLAVDREGRVHHEGQVMTHAGVADTFASGLDVNEAGEAIVRIGRQWAYVRCERTPFVVVRVQPGEGMLALTLNTGERLEIPAQDVQLHLEADRDLYVRIHAGRHEARFGRTAWAKIADLLEERDGRLWLPLGQAQVRIGT